MIVFGKKVSQLGTQSVRFRCSQCDKFDQTVIATQPYFHIYWIPFVPGRRKFTLVCRDCHQVVELNSQRQVAGPNRDDLKRQFPVKKRLFAGLVLFVAFVSFAVQGLNQTKENTLKYLQSPQVGDRYVFYADEDGDFDYTFGKIIEVTPDTVAFRLAKLRFRRSHHIDRGDQLNDRNYNEDIVHIPREKLVKPLVESVSR